MLSAVGVSKWLRTFALHLAVIECNFFLFTIFKGMTCYAWKVLFVDYQSTSGGEQF